MYSILFLPNHSNSSSNLASSITNTLLKVFPPQSQNEQEYGHPRFVSWLAFKVYLRFSKKSNTPERYGDGKTDRSLILTGSPVRRVLLPSIRTERPGMRV